MHHTILLWPLPQIAIALAFAQLVRWRGILTFGVLAIALSNVLVLNTYYACMMRNGGNVNWNAAMGLLAEKLRYIPANQVLTVDWGILDSLKMLDRGTLPVRMGNEPDPQWLRDPNNLFVDHSPEMEFFKGIGKKIEEMAAHEGFIREDVAEITDPQGRKVFQIWRFRQIGPSSPTPQ